MWNRIISIILFQTCVTLFFSTSQNKAFRLMFMLLSVNEWWLRGCKGKNKWHHKSTIKSIWLVHYIPSCLKLSVVLWGTAGGKVVIHLKFFPLPLLLNLICAIWICAYSNVTHFDLLWCSASLTSNIVWRYCHIFYETPAKHAGKEHSSHWKWSHCVRNQHSVQNVFVCLYLCVCVCVRI